MYKMLPCNLDHFKSFLLLCCILVCFEADAFLENVGRGIFSPPLGRKEYNQDFRIRRKASQTIYPRTETHLSTKESSFYWKLASGKPLHFSEKSLTKMYTSGLDQEGEKQEVKDSQKNKSPAALSGYDIMKFIHQKEFELRKLLEAHEDPDDVLQRRLNYASSTSSYRVARALKRIANPTDDSKMAVITEIKRKTPNGSAEPRSIASFNEIGSVAEQLANLNVDALIVGVDDVCYGGNHEDIRVIKEHFRTQVSSFVSDDASIPPIIARDIIIHPIQIALAVERGADAVILLASVLGPSLEEHMNVITMMGKEAIIECHTPNEIEYALNLGATMVMVTNWDRLTNTLHPDQASAVKHMIPDHITSIASGGITNHVQAAKLADEGYDAICIGEGLVHSTDIGQLVDEIRKRRGLPGQLRGWGVRAEEIDY